MPLSKSKNLPLEKSNGLPAASNTSPPASAHTHNPQFFKQQVRAKENLNVSTKHFPRPINTVMSYLK
jgi:hypothetical protein